jgi:hypothetical protein
MLYFVLLQCADTALLYADGEFQLSIQPHEFAFIVRQECIALHARQVNELLEHGFQFLRSLGSCCTRVSFGHRV